MANEQEREYEEGAQGTDIDRNDDPLKEYRKNEPMTPAKLNEHEPTAVQRDKRDQKFGSQTDAKTSVEEAREKARRSGMTKGTAGAYPTGDEYEQGSAGTNKY